MLEPVIPISQMPPLDEDQRDDAAFRGRDRAWAALVGLFDRYQREQGLTYEALGYRIKRSKSQVQRWLGSSFNMNLKSLGLLAEGLDADLVIDVRPRDHEQYGTNYCHPSEAAKSRSLVNGFVLTGTSAARVQPGSADPIGSGINFVRVSPVHSGALVDD